ncbi:MAG TPA: glycosyltransferase family 2 protein [Eudoraea sp.]|nr:glycosyltransferase family 2 protein [Eudoraea sp.]
MINGKRIAVILPAYNAEKTLEKTYRDIPHDFIDEIILTDDFSIDKTIRVAKNLGIGHIIAHNRNLGYGANQKTCYAKALELKADIVVMLHPDYQYNPKLIPAMSDLISNGVYDVVLGSRILGTSAIKEGMPHYKYYANRVLTAVQNLLMGQKLSEYHTGYRSFGIHVLKALPLSENSDDFLFDNQMLAQICYKGFNIGEISCPAKYEQDSSSINFRRSIAYGLGVLWVSLQYFLQKLGFKFKLFKDL